MRGFFFFFLKNLKKISPFLFSLETICMRLKTERGGAGLVKRNWKIKSFCPESIITTTKAQ